MIRDSGAKNVVAPFVVYNLPDRDCAALASNGELSLANGGEALYRGYIQSIRDILVEYPEITVVLVIEPDSLGNMITNSAVPKCQGAAAAYKSLTIHAIKQLSLPNVTMYVDGGHGGWLGWPANLGPAAQMYGAIYKEAGSKNLRGVCIFLHTFINQADRR
jgi:cellulose 1,4-beta-cellobiosidase